MNAIETYFQFCFPWVLFTQPIWMGILVAALRKYDVLSQESWCFCVIMSCIIGFGCSVVVPLVPFVIIASIPAFFSWKAADWCLQNISFKAKREDSNS